MDSNGISRRRLIKTGACTLVATSGVLHAAGEEAGAANLTNEQLIRQYYASYEKKDWSLLDRIVADDFTFTSPNNDDHISKSVYKSRCWPNSEFVDRFELENVLVKDNEALVKYLCRTTKGTSFRNVEYFRFANGKITANECYFGGRLGYPEASISGKP